MRPKTFDVKDFGRLNGSGAEFPGGTCVVVMWNPNDLKPPHVEVYRDRSEMVRHLEMPRRAPSDLTVHWHHAGQSDALIVAKALLRSEEGNLGRSGVWHGRRMHVASLAAAHRIVEAEEEKR